MQAGNYLTHRLRTIGDGMEIAAKVNQIGSSLREGSCLFHFCIQSLQTLPHIGCHQSLLLNILLTPTDVLHAVLTGIVELQLFTLQAHRSRQSHCVPTIAALLLILQQQFGRCHQPSTTNGCRHQSHKHAGIVAARLQEHLIGRMSAQGFKTGACQHHLFHPTLAECFVASAEGSVIGLAPVLVLSCSTRVQAGLQLLQPLLPVGIAQLLEGHRVALVGSNQDAGLFRRQHERREQESRLTIQRRQLH